MCGDICGYRLTFRRPSACHKDIQFGKESLKSLSDAAGKNRRELAKYFHIAALRIAMRPSLAKSPRTAYLLGNRHPEILPWIQPFLP
jgi:hypothetical protein